MPPVSRRNHHQADHNDPFKQAFHVDKDQVITLLLKQVQMRMPQTILADPNKQVLQNPNRKEDNDPLRDSHFCVPSQGVD